PHPMASILLAMAVFLSMPPDADAQSAVSGENIRIARSLATMLQSARAVISAEQELINDPDGGDKGLTGDVVLERAIANYREATGSDPTEVDPASYEGRLLKAQMDAVAAVVDAHQSTINAKGVGFKG